VVLPETAPPRPPVAVPAVRGEDPPRPARHVHRERHGEREYARHSGLSHSSTPSRPPRSPLPVLSSTPKPRPQIANPQEQQEERERDEARPLHRHCRPERAGGCDEPRTGPEHGRRGGGAARAVSDPLVIAPHE